MTACQHWRWYNKVTGESSLFSCRSPKCERAECQECWARRRIAIADDLIRRYHLDVFFTLTVDRSMECWQAWKSISFWWSKLRQRLKRYAHDMGTKLKFFAILECHKDGYPHIHGFWNIFLDVHDLSEMWKECAPGEVVHCETVKDEQGAANYLWHGAGRYIGKKQAVDGARKAGYRKRTMWRSVGLRTEYELRKDLTPECERDTMSEWVLSKTPPQDIVVYSKEELDYAQKKFCGQDLEGTRSEAPERCSEEGIQDMETEWIKTKLGTYQESTGSAWQDQRGYQTREREVVCAQDTIRDGEGLSLLL